MGNLKNRLQRLEVLNSTGPILSVSGTANEINVTAGANPVVSLSATFKAAGGDLAGTYPSPAIANNAVTNAKAATMPAYTVKSNATNASANAADNTVSTFQQNFIGASVTADGVFGSTGTINFNGTPPSYLHTCTLTSATACTLTFTAPPVPGVFVTLKITQPAAGAVTTVTWPVSVNWGSGTALQPTQTLGASTTFVFFYDGTSYYFIQASAYAAGSSGLLTFGSWTNFATTGRAALSINGGQLVGCGSFSASLAGSSSLNLNSAGGSIGLAVSGTLKASMNTNGEWKAVNYGAAANALGTVTSTATANFTASSFNTLTLTSATACTISFTAPANPCYVQVKISAPAAGSIGAVTWPGTVVGTPTAPTTLGKSRLHTFFYDGASYVLQLSSAEY